ncbi:MAG: thymidine kinase [Spirochaetota bacterium]|nr:thymidine kinase [Spirochaetota bacterium]
MAQTDAIGYHGSMQEVQNSTDTNDFLKSLGFPSVRIHHSFNHFDFSRDSRRILVIGPMGSGKTEYSSRVWRDSLVALKKSQKIADLTSTGDSDRRKVFFIRSMLDRNRFPDYPDDALAYRGGYERCGNNIAHISNSFELENILKENTHIGTWIIDEASFYDERLVYVVRNASQEKGLNFIFPTLILNFRKDIFNSTARLMLETATDVFPLTAYCEHEDCIEDSFYTYRYYNIDGAECPSLYFDPLIVIGGDREKIGSLEPNYCTRCDIHHYLPGKEYTFFTLKPLGETAASGSIEPLKKELYSLKNKIENSTLYKHLHERHNNSPEEKINLNSLKVDFISEKALIYLFAEQNLITEDLLLKLIEELSLDRRYMEGTLADNKRPINLDQRMLL